MKEIDLARIEAMAASGRTKSAVSAAIGCSRWTITRRPDLAAAFACGRSRANRLDRGPATTKLVAVRVDLHASLTRLSRALGISRRELIDAALRAHIAELRDRR